MAGRQFYNKTSFIPRQPAFKATTKNCTARLVFSLPLGHYFLLDFCMLAFLISSIMQLNADKSREEVSECSTMCSRLKCVRDLFLYLWHARISAMQFVNIRNRQSFANQRTHAPSTASRISLASWEIIERIECTRKWKEMKGRSLVPSIRRRSPRGGNQ
jgi:hypothetical protein